MSGDVEVPVLICGGSLVGLSAAMFLGHHGVRSLVVERHSGTAIHPRAAQISQRTMELFRQVGLERIVRARSEEQFVQDGAIVAVDTLAGRQIASYIANLNEGVREYSPCERVFISQSLLEPLMKQRAEELGADLRFHTDLVSFEQDEHGVTAKVQPRDGSAAYTVRAGHMIACDGARSRIRERLGIAMTGRGSFSRSITIYFRADVRRLLEGRNWSVIYVLNPSLRGFFRFEKPFDSGFLAVNAVGNLDHPETDLWQDLSERRALELVYQALGTRDVEVEVQNVMQWEAEASVAERFRSGHVFLAGDAAHVMPPNGGFGGNTGVQDAHNLAWKLARGGNLPHSYESERRPVAEFTVEQAYTRYVMRTAPYLGTEGLQPAAHDLNVEYGYGYGDAPLHQHPKDCRGMPGTRAPHVWLEDGRSTLDLFGQDYVDLEYDPRIAEAYGLGPGGSVRVRPDGFVESRR